MAEYYESSMHVRLSKNYNSVEVSARYGRDKLPNEKLDAHIMAVEAVVQSRIEALVAEADGLLSQTKTKDEFQSKKAR